MAKVRPGGRKLDPLGAAKAGARIVRRRGVDAVTMRSVAEAMPGGLAAACLDDWPELPAACRMMESLVAVAEDHTENTIDQCQIASAVFDHAVSRAVAEHARLVRRKEFRLPAVAARPAKYPRLASLDHRVELVDLDRVFEVGLDALLTGLLESRT